MIELHSDFKLNKNFGKVICEPSWKWNTIEQPLPDHDLWYVWSGEGSLVLNGLSYPLSQGSCFLFRQGDRIFSNHYPLKPLIVTFLHFDSPQEMLGTLNSYRQLRDTLLFETYLNRYVETMIVQSTTHEMEAKLLILLMLLELRREEEKGAEDINLKQDPLHAVIHNLAHWIRQSPGAGHSLHSLAERAQLSPRYFSVKFKMVMACTVESYVIRAKIQRAEQLLRYNGMNVTEVAKALGYKDPSFFSRQFKLIRGMSPSEIRGNS